MSKIIEQILSYLLGIVVGIVSGLLFWSSNFNFLKYENQNAILVIAALLGLIVSIIIIELKKAKQRTRNHFVRNEAIALITHEMRTRLTSTSWAIQLVLQKYGDKMSSEDKNNLQTILDSIHATVMHSVNLLDISILDISRLAISLERMPLKKIEEVLGVIIKEYAMGAEKKGIEFHSTVNLGKNKQAEVDVLRLRIILENLLENAFQYFLKEKKVVKVEISNTDKNLNIIVSDNGIGIPKKEQEKIFEEFFRASNAKQKRPNGSGIGLYACVEYIKAHKGTIRFESQENEGSTFFVSIPLTTEANISEFMQKV